MNYLHCVNLYGVIFVDKAVGPSEEDACDSASYCQLLGTSTANAY